MKSRELDKMDDTLTDFTQMGGVGEVGCPQWVMSMGEVTQEWIEDDDDFRVVLRRHNDVNAEQTGGVAANLQLPSRLPSRLPSGLPSGLPSECFLSSCR